MIEITELEVPEIIRDFLEPIPGKSSVGIDASNEEEYFLLNMEIPKTSPDYKKCIELSSVILQGKSKDIKVATWTCFAMFRTEKIKGLVNGFNLIYHLLKRYENNLFPENPNYRSKALQFLNQPRFTKLVERENPDLSNSKEFIEAGILIDLVVSESKRLFPENTPVLKTIVEVIHDHVETAKKILNPPKEKLVEQTVQDQPKLNSIPVEKPVSESIKQPIIEDKPIKQTVLVKNEESQPLKTLTENDYLIQLRQILIHFFEYQVEGAKKEKIPESYFIFGISRQLQWGKLLRPVDKEGITQIEAPNSIMQSNIKKWVETSDWDTLIPKLEINFLKLDSAFPYWIDSQRFLTKALETKGGNYVVASQDIKRQLSQLINRIPDIYKLKFKDRITPFADELTVKWIYDEVISVSGGDESNNQMIILPPIMGEDYESIGQDFQLACSELPNKIETNIAAMQKAIDTDNRRKGKFLRRLNLANYCMQAKQYELAKVHLTELSIFIDEYNLAIWESALCTAVWQSIYLVNKELISGRRDKELKMILEKEQIELFTKIAKYDSIVAIKLKQKK